MKYLFILLLVFFMTGVEACLHETFEDTRFDEVDIVSRGGLWRVN